MPHTVPAALLEGAARKSGLDMLLGSLGVSVAAASAGFAVYMVAIGPAAMNPHGSGDFNVFARLDKRDIQASSEAFPPLPAPPAVPAPVLAMTAAPEGIDFTPTGSIAGASAARAPASAQGLALERPGGKATGGRLANFLIRDVFDGKAVIESRNKLHLVEPGSTLEEAGEVLAIRRSGDGWVVETTNGLIGR